MNDRQQYISKSWQTYRALFIPSGASEQQIEATRQAYFTGAAALFETIMRAMDRDREPDEKDLRILADMQHEIWEFGEALDRKLFGANKH